MRHRSRSRLSIVLLLVQIVTLTGQSFATGVPGAERPAELLMNEFPVLPPDARKKFELTSQDPTAVADLAIADFFQLVADILKMNIVIADRTALDGRRVGIVMRDMSIEEAVHLVLQMNDLKAVHFNDNTIIVMARDSRAAFGTKQAKTYRLRYTTIDKVREYVSLNRNIQRQLGENISFDSANNSIIAVDSPENHRLLEMVVSQLDSPPAKLLESVKLSYLDFAQFTTLARALGTDVTNRLAAMGLSYNQQGRLLMVYGTPEDIGLVRNLVGKLDVAPKQVLIDTSFLQVSSSFNREFGFKFTNNSFTVNQFDRIKDIDRVNAQNSLNQVFPTRTQINYLISKTGAKTIQSPKVRAIDNTAATINIGEIRNIQIQSTATTVGTGVTPGQQQTTFNTQEVPIGVQVNVTPQIHNDDSVTLDMRISVTKVLEIKSFGVDRTTQDSTTRLRMRNGETVVLGGFINQVLNTDDTPIPILGEIPLLEKVFRNKKREQSDSELVFLLTPYILDFQDKATDVQTFPSVAPVAEAAVPAKAAPAAKPAAISSLPGDAKAGTAVAMAPGAVAGEIGKPQTLETKTVRVVEGKTGTATIVYDAAGKIVQRDYAPKALAAAEASRPVSGAAVLAAFDGKSDGAGAKVAANRPVPAGRGTAAGEMGSRAVGDVKRAAPGLSPAEIDGLRRLVHIAGEPSVRRAPARAHEMLDALRHERIAAGAPERAHEELARLRAERLAAKQAAGVTPRAGPGNSAEGTRVLAGPAQGRTDAQQPRIGPGPRVTSAAPAANPSMTKEAPAASRAVSGRGNGDGEDRETEDDDELDDDEAVDARKRQAPLPAPQVKSAPSARQGDGQSRSDIGQHAVGAGLVPARPGGDEPRPYNSTGTLPGQSPARVSGIRLPAIESEPARQVAPVPRADLRAASGAALPASASSPETAVPWSIRREGPGAAAAPAAKKEDSITRLSRMATIDANPPPARAAARPTQTGAERGLLAATAAGVAESTKTVASANTRSTRLHARPAQPSVPLRTLSVAEASRLSATASRRQALIARLRTLREAASKPASPLVPAVEPTPSEETSEDEEELREDGEKAPPSRRSAPPREGRVGSRARHPAGTAEAARHATSLEAPRQSEDPTDRTDRRSHRSGVLAERSSPGSDRQEPAGPRLYSRGQVEHRRFAPGEGSGATVAPLLVSPVLARNAGQPTPSRQPKPARMATMRRGAHPAPQAPVSSAAGATERAADASGDYASGSGFDDLARSLEIQLGNGSL